MEELVLLAHNQNLEVSLEICINCLRCTEFQIKRNLDVIFWN